MNPLRPPINKSTAIAATGYDAVQQVLAVQFAGGLKVHHYRGVPPEIADGLHTAESAGRYYAAHIRGKFDSVPVTEDDAAQTTA